MGRKNARPAGDLREVRIEPNFTRHAEGSVLVCFGDTRVVCNATLEEKVPSFLRGTGKGWVTAEYGMLPRSTHTRTDREAAKGKQTGRTQEIQRLVGRALRAATSLQKLGERQVTVDCDVLQADGGTRTAAITGGYVALALALDRLAKTGLPGGLALGGPVAAVSVGRVGGRTLLDLDYEEDSGAEVDMNVVALPSEMLVEVQGTAEHAPFSRETLQEMLDIALAGIAKLHAQQRRVLAECGVRVAGGAP